MEPMERPMEVRVLGAHNLESNETRHTCLLVDGMLGLDAGSLVSALSWSEQARIQALLITHRHFDHTRDIPTLGLARQGDQQSIDVYSLGETLESVHDHLIDGDVYPDFTKELNGTPPKYRFHPVEPGVSFQVLEYHVTPVPMPHPVPALGYIVRADSGSSMAYTGDTGGDLAPFLTGEAVPDVLFVDVTFPNGMEAHARLTGHLTPSLLRHQLQMALKSNPSLPRPSLPRIVAVHISPTHQDQVEQQLSALAGEMGLDLTPGYEDMVLA